MRLVMLTAMVLVGSGLSLGCAHAATAVSTAAADGIARLPGPDACSGAPVVTLEELENGAHANERVIVEAVPVADLKCTLLGCSAGNKCCNSCTGGYVLRRGEKPMETLRVQLSFDASAGVGCSGTECVVQCSPFGKEPTHAVRFLGLNAFTPKGTNAVWAQSTLTVEKMCRAKGAE